jgi:probable HAF family extracellular repeat protein
MMKRALLLLLPLALVACQETPDPVSPDPSASKASSEGSASSRKYRITDLGTLGGTASFGLGINNRGQVVGNSRTGAGSRPLLAFLWKNGAMTSLGSLPGSTFSRAFNINNQDIAVGEAFTPSPEVSRAVRWKDGIISDLGTLGSASGAVANDINARGEIAGVSGGRAVVWDNRGRIRDIGTISEQAAATSRGNAINGDGSVVGSSQTDILSEFGSRVSHAFLWTPRRMIDLGTLGDPRNFSVAFGVNERGDVVGEAHIGGNTFHAWVWRRGAMTDIHPAEFGLRHSRASKINSRGQIVGHVTGFQGFATIDGRAILWQNGDAIDLNTLIPEGSGWVLRTAEGINDRGDIVGYGSFQGETRAYLLTRAGDDDNGDDD